MATINFIGTGGILEGNLGSHTAEIELDPALKFDGTNDYITCGTDTDYDISADLCIAAWIKNDNSTTTSGSSEMILSKYAGTNGQRCYRLYAQGQTLKFGVSGTGGTSADTYTLDYSIAGSLDKWNHFAGVWDSGHMYIYLNGKQVAYHDFRATETAINVQNSRAVEIGSYEGGSNTWEGQIADVRIYNDNLITGGAGTATTTSTHIELLASKINTDKTLGAGTTNLKGYWKLSGEAATGGVIGSGTGYVPDESGNGQQGVLTNFPTSPTYWDYDAFSVDVQSSLFTSGSMKVLTGRLECLSLSYVHNDETNDATLSANEAAAIDDLTALTKGTFACWTRADNWSATSDDDHWIYNLSDATDDYFFVVHMDDSSGTTAKVRTALFENGAYQWEVSTDSRVCSLDTWHHIAVTQDGSGPVIYVDGVKPAQTFTNSTDTAAWWDELHGIGADRNMMGGGFHYNNNAHQYEPDGDFRDFRFYNYALNADQMSSLYSGSYNVTPMHWIKCDEGSGTLADSGTDTAWNVTNTNLTYVDGSAEVRGQTNIGTAGDGVTIKGILSAPRGEYIAMNHFADCGKYIHNNGTYKSTVNGIFINRFTSVNKGRSTRFYNVIQNNGTMYFQNNAVWDYTNLDGAISSATATSVPVNTTENLTVGEWLKVGTEYMRIEGISGNTLTVSRGQLGSTAATHSDDAAVGFFPVIRVEKLLDIDSSASSDTILFQPHDADADMLIEFGTDSDYATIENNGVAQFVSDAGTHNFITIGGVSSLYPVRFTGTDIDWGSDSDIDGAPSIGLRNVDYQISTATIGGSNNAFVKLYGDCTFDAVTVDAGSRLDINGHRAAFSGTLDVNGTLYNTAGTQASPGQIWGNSLQIASTNNADDLDLISDGGYFDADQTTYNNLFMRSGTFTIGGTRDWGGNTLLLGGTANFTSTNGWGGIHIATGGVFNAGSQDVTCSGDFTTSGGLLVASCLELLNTSDPVDAEYAYNSGQDWQFVNEFTIEMWFKTSQDADMTLLDLRDDAADDEENRIHIFTIASANEIRFVRYDQHGSTGSGSTTSAFRVGDFHDGKWHHLAVTNHATDGAKMYIDGELNKTNSHTITRASGQTLRMHVGRRSGDDSGSDGGYFTGQIDELRLFQDERTQDEIRANMFIGVHDDITGDNLIARYAFDEGTSNTITNSQGTGTRDLAMYDSGSSASDLWATPGNGNSTGYVRGTSTLIMDGTGVLQTAYNTDDSRRFYNLTVSGTTTINQLGDGSGMIDIYGPTLNVSGTLISHSSNAVRLYGTDTADNTISMTVGTAGSSVSQLKHLYCYAPTRCNLPAMTTKNVRATTGTTYMDGDITCSEGLYVAGGSDAILNSKGYDITTPIADVARPLNLEKASTLTFTDTSGCGFGSSSGTLNCEGSAGASFDGNDDKMQADSNPLPGSGPFTFTMFFRTSETGIRQGLVDFTNNSARGMLDVMTDNKLLIYLGSSNYRYWDPITSYLDGNWHHMSLYIPGYAQADVENITMHIDGNLINPSATVASGAAEQPTMAHLRLGSGYSSGNAWDGDLADARIFTKALTDANRTTLRAINPSAARAGNYPDNDNDIGATHWWKLNESNFPTDDAADSVGSIDCSVTGAVPNRINIRSAAGGGTPSEPSNKWDLQTTMTITADYTTFDYYKSFECDGGTININNCTLQNVQNGQKGFAIKSGCTVGSFKNNTINTTISGGSSIGIRGESKSHAAFDNITITGTWSDTVNAESSTMEFTNSNFDFTNVGSNNASGHIISKTHNDTENLYEMFLGSGALAYSAITNQFGTDADVKLRAGILTMNQDNKVCDTFNVFTGATIRVSDAMDLYVQGSFDNDGTWVQTAGYGGDIHVGDFTPFDSGDILDNTDFVDTGFHDTSHYLEMDL